MLISLAQFTLLDSVVFKKRLQPSPKFSHYVSLEVPVISKPKFVFSASQFLLTVFLFFYFFVFFYFFFGGGGEEGVGSISSKKVNMNH